MSAAARARRAAPRGRGAVDDAMIAALTHERPRHGVGAGDRSRTAACRCHGPRRPGPDRAEPHRRLLAARRQARWTSSSTITEGVPAKGMIAWKDSCPAGARSARLPPSSARSAARNPPNPKAPQGERVARPSAGEGHGKWRRRTGRLRGRGARAADAEPGRHAPLDPPEARRRAASCGAGAPSRWALIALFALMPHLRMGGKPLVLLDLVPRRFTLFGATFLPDRQHVS